VRHRLKDGNNKNLNSYQTPMKPARFLSSHTQNSRFEYAHAYTQRYATTKNKKLHYQGGFPLAHSD